MKVLDLRDETLYLQHLNHGIFTIPDGYDSIVGEVREEYKPRINKIIIPASIKYICCDNLYKNNKTGFNGCRKVRTLVIDKESKLIKIGDGAFENCANLSKAWRFPSSLDYIGSRAFADCVKLAELTFDGSNEFIAIADHAFAGCRKLKTLQINYRNVVFGANVFEGCTSFIKYKFSKANRNVTFSPFTFDQSSVVAFNNYKLLDYTSQFCLKELLSRLNEKRGEDKIELNK